MPKSIQVSASILCADFTNLGDEIKKCEDAGVDMIHVDVMDGHFVPNISIGQGIVKAIRPITKLPIEAHLMIEHPSMYVESFIEAGSDIISVHAECYGRLRKEFRGLDQFPKEVDSINAEKVKKDILKTLKANGGLDYRLFPPTFRWNLCSARLTMGRFDNWDGWEYRSNWSMTFMKVWSILSCLPSMPPINSSWSTWFSSFSNQAGLSTAGLPKL